MKDFVAAAVRLVYDGRWKTQPTTAEHFSKLLQQPNLGRWITPDFVAHLYQLTESDSAPAAVKDGAQRSLMRALASASEDQKTLFDPARYLVMVQSRPTPKQSFENPWLHMSDFLAARMSDVPFKKVHPGASSQSFFDLVKQAYEGELKKPQPDQTNLEYQYKFMDLMLLANPELGKNPANVSFLLDEDVKVLMNDNSHIKHGDFFAGKRNYLAHLSDAASERLFDVIRGAYLVADAKQLSGLGRMLSKLVVVKPGVRTTNNITWMMREIDNPNSSTPVEDGRRMMFKDGANELFSGLLQLMSTDPVSRREVILSQWMRGHIKAAADGTRYADSWRQVALRDLGKLLNKSGPDASAKLSK